MMGSEPNNGQGDEEQLILAEATPRAPLDPKLLRWRCDPARLSFRSTVELEPVTGVIGQEAAVEALRFGLEIDAPGQNIFVRGLVGTGRMTLVRRLLEEIKPACPHAQDRCYVHHFAQPDRPRLITLPRGRGPIFRRRIDDLIDFIRDDLEGLLSSETLQTRRTALDQENQRKIDAIVKPFEQTLHGAGLTLVSLQVGPAAQAGLLPMVNGKPVPPELWEQLKQEGTVSEEDAARYEKQAGDFQPQLREVMTKVNEIRRGHVEAVRSMRHDAVRVGLAEFEREIKAAFPFPAVGIFLDELIDDVAGKLSRASEFEFEEDDLRRYRVNVLITHAQDTSCSIIVENTPTISNLLGTIDHIPDRSGSGRSDHLMVRAGSLLRADGGYLILEAREVIREPGAWKVLIRTLRTGRLEIVPPEMTFPWWSPSLKPEPIAVNVKVILLGGLETYYLLDAYDPDFPHLFKVLADFDSSIPRTPENVVQYGGVLARIAAEEGLLPFANTAVAALAEHGARIAGRKGRLTTRFGRLADIAREAAFIARKGGKSAVTGDEVREAFRRAKQRGELPSRRFRELLADGTLRVTTQGSAVGQVNGLASYTPDR